MSETKRCKGCLDIKELNEFQKHANSAEGRLGFCKNCMSAFLRKKERLEDQTTEKVCKTCNLSKPLSAYSLACKNKGGYNVHCSTCYRKKWRDDGSVVKAKLEAFENNTIKCNGCNILKQLDEYNKDPKGFGGYKSKCKTCLVQQKKVYTRYKRATDDMYRLQANLRRRVSNAIQNNRQGKAVKSAHTMELVGCPIPFLVEYIEKQFVEGMSWSNYGKWHIDHIKPCASFDLAEEEQQKQCFHYTNLQPLWAEDNLKKGKKLDW